MSMEVALSVTMFAISCCLFVAHITIRLNRENSQRDYEYQRARFDASNEATGRLLDAAENAQRAMERALKSAEQQSEKSAAARYGTFDETSLTLAKAVIAHDRTSACALVDYLNENPHLLKEQMERDSKPTNGDVDAV